MKAGTFGTLPDWALEALPDLSPTAILVLTRLAYVARLSDPTLTRGQLLDYTRRSPDQLARALKELTGAGHIRTVDGVYALKDAGVSARTNARKNAACQPEKRRAARQKTSPEEVEEVKEVNLASLEVNLASLQVELGVESGLREEAEQTTDEGGEEKPTRFPSSQDVLAVDGQGGEPRFAPSPPRSARPPAPPRPADHGDDDAAVRFFHDLAGYGFVMGNRAHLARWHRDYSPEFLRLALQAARTMRDVRVPTAGFVWLLNGEKPWPDELKRQYAADQRARQSGEGNGDAPFVGEIRVLKDGRSGRVLDVSADDRKLTLQVGQDETESVWVPWSVTTPAVRRSA